MTNGVVELILPYLLFNVLYLLYTFLLCFNYLQFHYLIFTGFMTPYFDQLGQPRMCAYEQLQKGLLIIIITCNVLVQNMFSLYCFKHGLLNGWLYNNLLAKKRVRVVMNLAYSGSKICFLFFAEIIWKFNQKLRNWEMFSTICAT